MKGLAYYEAVAQIIPVLVLVLVVEYRLLEHRRWEKAWQSRLAMMLTGLLMLLVIWGELSALAVLKEEKERAASYGWTLAAVIILLGMIVFAAEARRRPTDSTSDSSPSGRS